MIKLLGYMGTPTSIHSFVLSSAKLYTLFYWASGDYRTACI